MSDESQLQIRPREGDSSLSLSKARSGLVERGRRDATVLPEPIHPASIDPLLEIRRLAEEGDADAQFNLGTAYYTGDVYKKRDFAEAVRWFRKAAEQGHAGAQFWLGFTYEYSHHVQQDYVEAVRWYGKAAEQGFADAQHRLGVAYYNGNGVPQDRAEGLKWYHKAANAGSPAAAEHLGYSYYDGVGVQQNYAEAVKWLRKSTPTEFSVAEFCLGKCYFYGLGVQQDYAEATRWLIEALGVDDSDAPEIGYLLSRIDSLDEAVKRWRWPVEGEDSWQEYAERTKSVREWVETGYIAVLTILGTSAVERRNIFQFYLGLAYAYGIGVPQDYTEAVAWLRRAADAGEIWAQFHLAVAYTRGRGVTQDYVHAHMWFNVVAFRTIDDQQKYASDARSEVAHKMTPQQIAEAERLAREWKPTGATG